ncbi:hypothetical protein DPMN_047064 [Dreissena polymorpha]|uniref:Uncharacterized protein n=1 Tax=Dreissena polymorpha TaxID=45954 RepID=A0A9D4DAS0_DREPO|nr:hypothetical protein DPMN_047064 [Dreissena polymorpha]
MPFKKLRPYTCNYYQSYFILFKETGYIDEPYPANDIAILRLEHPALLSNYTRPVCLSSPLLSVGGVAPATSAMTLYDAYV